MAGALAVAVATYCSPVVHGYTLPVPSAKTEHQFAGKVHRADFKGVTASADARLVADWMVRTNKNRAGPFIIADKAGGTLYAFDREGLLIAKSPALYGKARGDTLTDAQAAKPIAAVTDADKVTPAGLFYAKGVDTHYGPGVVLAEYAMTRISIHQVVGSGTERRLGRIQSVSLADHRVTFGCINATADFISQVVVPFFGGESVIAVLPEQQAAQSFFGIADAGIAKRMILVLGVDQPDGAVGRSGGEYLERRRIVVQQG